MAHKWESFGPNIGYGSLGRHALHTVLQTANPKAVYGDTSRDTVDTNVLTERTVAECTPDLVLYWRDKKVMAVFEVACA